MRLFQPLGIEAEFLGHLDEFLGGFRILDGLGQLAGPVGLIAVVIGLSHGGTSPDESEVREKGSMPREQVGSDYRLRGKQKRAEGYAAVTQS